MLLAPYVSGLCLVFVVRLSCSFDTEIKAKNQEQANLTKQRLNLEKEQKRLQRQQEKKVSCLSASALPASLLGLMPCREFSSKTC